MSVGLAVFTAGCAVGPSYVLPESPQIQQYSDTPLLNDIGQMHPESSQTFHVAEDLPEQWWTLFQSHSLNKLIQLALDNNPELDAAEASLRQAQENFYAQGSARLPAVDVQTGITRQKFSGASVGFPETPSSLFTLYNASIDVSYNIDLFGKTSNMIQLAEIQLHQTQLKREATYQTLIANLVNQTIQVAALRDELSQRRALYDIELQRLKLFKGDAELGGTAPTQVILQSQHVTKTSAELFATQKQLAFAQHQLAVLLGQNPAQIDVGKLSLNDLTLPKDLPVSLPSLLVKQRPDIQLAEHMIRARHAELGIAIANQLPQLTLNGSYGALSTETSDMFDPASMVWNVGAGLTQPLFRGGQLRHRKKAAEAQLDEAKALYRQTVLMAFQQVADSLRALEFDAAIHSGAIGAEQSSDAIRQQTEQEKTMGSASVLDMLDAERQYLERKADRIRARATQLTDTVALFQSLGGSWQSKQNSSAQTE